MLNEVKFPVFVQLIAADSVTGDCRVRYPKS